MDQIRRLKYSGGTNYFSYTSYETIFLDVAYERNHPLKSYPAGGRTPFFRIIERSKNPQDAVGWSRGPIQYVEVRSLQSLSGISGMP